MAAKKTEKVEKEAKQKKIKTKAEKPEAEKTIKPKVEIEKPAVADRGIAKILKDGAKTGKLLIGARAVTKGLKRGHVEYAVYASNCPDSISQIILYYGKVSNISITPFEGDSTLLGELCGKSFTVLVAGIRK